MNLRPPRRGLLRSQGRTLAACITLAAGAATADAERALLEAHEVGGGWEVVREVPVDPAQDADLREWGVREQHVRHYTRDLHGRNQVCSVEVWAFASTAQASAAEQGFAYPDWRFSRVGRLLVMARGLVRMPGRRPIRGVFPECEAIVSRVVDRAAAL